MDQMRLQRERARAENHGLRRTILKLLEGGAERTLPELAATMPDAGKRVLPETLPEAVIAYHLRVLHRAALVGFTGDMYRATG